MTSSRRALLALLVFVGATGASAQQQQPALRLPRLFADGMVVQRDRDIPVWGWASPRANVQVSFHGRSARATANADGAWTLSLPAASAGGPFELRVASGSDNVVLHDVLVGDVWIASGQSNMEFAVASGKDAAREIASAHDSLVRQFKVPISYANAPLPDVTGGSWTRADPAHVGAFSAVAWFFARDLRKAHQGVPIGIINTTWGGSAIETWLSRSAQHLGDSAWSVVLRSQEQRSDSTRTALRTRLGELPTKDAGWDDGRAPWASPTLDDSGWSTMPVPAYWEGNGLEGVDGVAWYRTTFTLSESDVRAGLDLTMQAIDDDDITWINGTEVGRTVGYNVPRKYVIPGALLHEGKNSLVVRVADGGGGGGINAPVALVRRDGVSAPVLDARWKFKLGVVSFQADGQQINKVPAVTYNAMVAPLLPIPVKGVIWYQGESNANNDAQALAYRDQFANLITSWRKEWSGGKDGFPFLWVQLPNYGKPDSTPPVSSSWALHRESMAAALTLPNTGQAIAIDVGEPGDIHPKNKQDVGARLALVARRVAYGDRVLASGPRYRSHVVRGDTIVVSFSDAASGLTALHSEDAIGGFAIAGADHKWARANARIVGNAVHVWSPSVHAPIAVRYAWANSPYDLDLYNRERLPAAPFRTDSWRTWTAAEDHAQMKQQLGITALRPGPSGNESAPNHANYDEALANPFPKLPEVLTLRNGRRVTNAREWVTRRAEIIEDFDREVFGRVPARAPKVTWTVTTTDTGTIQGKRVIGRQLVGHVDNTTYPAIDVGISMMLVVPADAKGPVPLMMMFRGGALAQAVGRPLPPPPAGRPGFNFPPPEPGSDAPATEQLIIDGWGYAWINPASIQADNGAGLTQGVIGLVNKGQPRKPDDWGALRAWGWGASRALDFLETDPAVNAKQVSIEGVSRYGKAALVTMAYDERFAAVLIGSSGEGGAKLHRRNWGEAVESLTGSGEYHWMAGNFLKYGTSASSFGSKNAGDIPVDSHELIALCAPRLTFVSYGVPEKGDAKWLDHQGSYMAAVAAQPVFRLLGAKALGVSDDYMKEGMPAVNVSMLDGKLAWRQHDGGHTDAPNIKYFVRWADGFYGRSYTPAPPVPAATPVSAPPAAANQEAWPADKPMQRTDANSVLAHQQLLEKKTKGKIDVYFVGNSITRRWGATDYPDFLANWKSNFFGWNAADFGWGADKVENMLWRMENGELDGVNPKVIVILAGTNNVGNRAGTDEKVADITRGLKALLDLSRRKAPKATIILTGIFPRNDNMAVVPEITRINANIARFADGKSVRYINVNDKLASADGVLFEGMTVDKLHPTVKGYQIWADALKPVMREILGPPASTDSAPPPTGDPSAKKP